MPRGAASSGWIVTLALALAPHEERLRREGGVQEVVRGRRDEGERIAPRELGRARRPLARRHVARDGVVPLRAEPLATRSSHFPEGVGKPPSAKGTHGSGTLRRTEPSRSSRSKVIPAMWGWSQSKACARHLLVALAQARVVEAHARGEPAEQLRVRQRLAERRDRRPAEADVEVAVGLVDVVVLEGRRGRQHDVGEVDGVGLEQLVDDDEEVLAREARGAPRPARAPPRPGSSCRRRAPSRAGRASRRSGSRPSWLMLSVRVPGGTRSGRSSAAVVHRERARGGEEDPAARVAPGPDHRGQAGDRAHRHAAPGVAVQAVVEADGRGPRRRVLAGERLDLLRPQAGRRRRPRGRPLRAPARAAPRGRPCSARASPGPRARRGR